ncbi:MAG TPA: hypothetical protein VMY37_29155 [Thermoguttaceae bacterium]|nr:hypothetical protein [Thermoguttaceae bacterium]
MRHSTRLRGLLVGSIVSCCLVAAVRRGEAAEEAWRFLEGLRERGYYDMALDYLTRIEVSPQCPEDLKEQIDYERGVTLIAASRVAGAAREQQLDQARDALQKFVAGHPQHALAATANTQLANVLVERGRMKAELATRPSKSADEKKQLMAEARKHYEEAQKVFVAAEQRVYERAKALEEEAKTDSKKVAERDEARRDLLQARLYLAGVIYEIGKTYDPASKQFQANLTEAAKKYQELYDKYKQFTAGLYAHMQEGRIYKDLGENDKAIQVLREMLTVPGGDATARMLRNESLGLLLETYLSPKVKNYAEALTQVAKWQEAARGAEESSPEGLKIRFLAGRAALASAEALKPDDPKRRDHLKTARQHFEFVGRFRGEHQREAREMLTQELLGGEVDTGEPKTFVDAKDQGDFAWGTMVVASGKTQDAKTAEEKKKSTAQMNQARDEAFQYYRLALGLRTDETPVAEVNVVRLYLAYLYFMNEDFYRAAVMGEFVATHYPQSMGAQRAAEIAIKAYRTLYTLSPKRKEERTFETRRMTQIAKFITTRWAGQPQANEAWMMLLDTAVDNRDLDTAQQCLANIDPESPRRAEAELRTGQALWASYVQESNKPEEERPEQAKLDELITKAQQTLEQGIARMRKSVDQGGAVDYTLAYSVLSLAQIYIGAGQSEKAVKWLDDPKIGPMTLVAAKHPATDKENFRVETYKAALRAYVGAQELDKAEEAMDALEAAVAEGGDATAAGKLTEIYRLLGQELQEALKRLRQENKNEEAERVTRGFEVLLSRISKREKGNTFNSLNWVADTFYNLGAGLDPEGEETPEKAKTYYKSAGATYLTILTKIKEDKKGEFAPPGAETSIQLRLAVCLRGLDEHPKAMEMLAKILRDRETHVSVQVEAARTCQDWARMKATKRKRDCYNVAMRGGNGPILFELLGEKTTLRWLKELRGYFVWGWGGIAKRVAPFDKYQDTFHEARYNLALCRMELAQLQHGTEREKTLKMAELDITRVHQLYPKMGGEGWYQKYDALLKAIQRLLGKPAQGLQGDAKASSQAK